MGLPRLLTVKRLAAHRVASSRRAPGAAQREVADAAPVRALADFDGDGMRRGCRWRCRGATSADGEHARTSRNAGYDWAARRNLRRDCPRFGAGAGSASRSAGEESAVLSGGAHGGRRLRLRAIGFHDSFILTTAQRVRSDEKGSAGAQWQHGRRSGTDRAGCPSVGPAFAAADELGSR